MIFLSCSFYFTELNMAVCVLMNDSYVINQSCWLLWPPNTTNCKHWVFSVDSNNLMEWAIILIGYKYTNNPP